MGKFIKIRYKLKKTESSETLNTPIFTKKGMPGDRHCVALHKISSAPERMKVMDSC